MFKYAPGMESGLGAALNMMRKHAEPDGDEGTTVLQACVEAGIRPYASRNSGSPSVHLRGNS